jgi:hypothetical protein
MNPEPHEHEAIPGPTIWPAVVAVGITVLGMGIITSGVFVVGGLATFLLGLGGWIGELRHER